jgi:hypothetical protein
MQSCLDLPFVVEPPDEFCEAILGAGGFPVEIAERDIDNVGDIGLDRLYAPKLLIC